MTKKLFIFGLAFCGLLFIPDFASAQTNPFSMEFPIPELGNCGSYEACKVYCNDSANTEACVTYAEKNNLGNKNEVKAVREISDSGGPGGCKSEAECKNYCEGGENCAECIAFAEKHGFLPENELEQAKKMCGKSGPGGCKGKTQCDTYCNNPNNMEECITFGIENNLMPSGEIEEAKKMLNALKKGVKPPACNGKEACDKYCQEPEHAEECINFGIAAGFIPPEEAEQIKKMMKTGIMTGPGGCKGKAECDAFCQSPEHMDECMNFAVKNGMMSAEEVERAEQGMQMMQKGGPGGCKGPEECRAFCDNPDNQEECMKFAKDNNMMPQEEMKRMEKDIKMMRQGGPGGCKSPDECRTFCDNPSNQEECFKFARDNGIAPQEQLQQMEKGMQMIRQGGPGGCKNPEECRTFCDDPSNTNECMNFGEKSGMMKPQEVEMRRNEFNESYKQFQMMGPPEGMRPPEGYQQPPEGFRPPEGYQRPPEGSQQPPQGGEFRPPEGFQQPPSTAPGEFVPLAPPTEPTAPPPSGGPAPAPEPAPAPAPAPESMLKYSPFGVILNFFLGQ